MAKQNKIKQAVILAGGRGMRLWPLTDDRPKPMVPVNGRPFLEYLVDLLKENGVKEIVMLLGYLPEKITEHFGNGSKFGVKIKYSIGAIDDETGTRINNARDLLDEHFVLSYCDNYWPINLSKMSDFYFNKGVVGTMTAYNNKDGGGEYGPRNNLNISDGGMVKKYLVGDYSEDPVYNAIDAGVFILDKKILGLMPEGNFSFQKEILPKLVASGQLAAFRMDHPYCAITSMETLASAEKFLKQKKVIFLDRDGVINKRMPPHEYAKNVADFEFLPGAVASLKKLKDAGYKIFLVTNQAGIAKGLMSEADLQKIHEYMFGELAKAGTTIDGIYFCSHGYSDGCDCRKPKPGLFFKAARENFLDLTKTLFIGDSETDAEAALAAGCKFELASGTRTLEAIVSDLIR